MNQKKFKQSTAFRFKRFGHRAYSAFSSMHKVVSIGVITACMLTFANSSKTSAQTVTTAETPQKVSDKELDEVTVTASRVELSLNKVAKLITVITRDEIQRAPVQSIQDLLNYAAGVDVIQRGGHGVQADISIRGGSSDQTAILLNGVNLSNPQTGHYSFDIPINLHDIERIEIIHGSSSLIYGASAFSGGINIITKKNPDHKAYAKIQAGGHQLFGVEAGTALQTGVATNQLSVGYNTSDGYIANSDYDILNLLWQTRLNVEQSKIDIQLGYNDKQYGANTFYSAAYPNQYDKTKSYLASVKGETGKKLKFIPQIYWNRHHDEFQLIKGNESKVPYNHHRTDVYGANLNIQYESKLGITSFGSELRNEGIVSSVLGKEMNEPDGKYLNSDDRTNISYTLEHNLLIDKFSLSAGILANYNTAFRGDYKFYPNINANYQVIESLKIYSSWAKATRMPTFTDLYYTTKTHLGNTDIKPEDSETFELGFRYSHPFVRAYVNGFYMKGKNIIDWVKENPDDKWESRNHTKINKKGIEAGLKFYLRELFPDLDPATTLQLGYTRLHQNKSSGELISNYTLNYLRDKFTAQLNHPIYKDISAGWNFRWQKRMGEYVKYENLVATTTEPFSPFATLDLQLNWVLKDFKINLTANNIFDKKYIDLGNIPQSGFWLIGGVSYTLK